MDEICKRENCIGCLNCQNSCNFSAIETYEDELGFVYAKKNLDRCIQCGMCSEKCPVQRQDKHKIDCLGCYAFKHNNEDIRLKSSSGRCILCVSK